MCCCHGVVGEVRKTKCANEKVLKFQSVAAAARDIVKVTK